MSPRFPWPTFNEQWNCRVERLLLDGEDATAAIYEDHLAIDTHALNWSEATVFLTASTDEPTPDGLTDLSAYVMVTCGATQLRLPYQMTYNLDRTAFEAKIRIPRAALAGKANILAQITSDRGGRRRVVGSSIAWTVVLEKGESPARSGSAPLKTTWVDFSAGDAPPEARQNPTTYCCVDINHDPPTLFLNSGIDGFQSLILAENAKLERRRHRDLLGAMIAKQVANSLVRAAVDEVEPGEFGAPAAGPTSRILREMCEALAQELPETETVEDLYELVADLPGNGLAAGQFWSQVDLALDRMTSLADVVAKTCKEVKHV